MSISVLFIPGNPAHVRTQLPIAEELRDRGHQAAFILRDSVIPQEYRVFDVLRGCRFPVHHYNGFYRSDIWNPFPSILDYKRSKRELARFLDSLHFDVSVSCNDTSALFDRLVLAYSRNHRRVSVLVQESIRPSHRRLHSSLAQLWKDKSQLLSSVYRHMCTHIGLRDFASRKYGHSDCTLIAAAGDRFRRQLTEDGVFPDKICVTGQPRLDQIGRDRQLRITNSAASAQQTVLFCTQPLECSRAAVDNFFIDLVRLCDVMEDVRLFVKLHPRDLPATYWQSILPSGVGTSIAAITATQPLQDCFHEADAMLTIASTTAVEAMAVGLPVGLINYLPTIWYLPYHDLGAALSIDSNAELCHGIRRLLFDTDLRETLISNSGRIIHDELYLCDGKSAGRIVDVILQRVQSPA